MLKWLDLLVRNILKEKKIKKVLDTAQGYKESHEYKKAIDVLKEIQKSYLEDGRVDLLLAQTYKEQDDWDAAILEYKSAIEKFLYKNNYHTALVAFEELMQSYPNTTLDARLLFEIACCYERKKEYKQAVEVYKKLIVEYPFSELIDTALYIAADISFKNLEDIKTAKRLYEELITRFPKSEWIKPAKKRLNLINLMIEEEEEKII